jgi:ribonuclease BN (tRNA processing enzyme)
MLLIYASAGIVSTLFVYYRHRLSLGAIDKLFLTHLHSDHILSVPDLFLVGWSNGGRNTPLKVWGPVGTKYMMDSMANTFEFDSRIRALLDDERTKKAFVPPQRTFTKA